MMFKSNNGVMFFMLIVMVLAFMSMSAAQTRVKVEDLDQTMRLVTFTTVVDSEVTVSSEYFQLGKFQVESFYTVPPLSGFKQTAPAGKPRLTCTIIGSFDGSTEATILDTSGAVSDSSATLTVNTTVNFNDKHYPYYKFKIKGETGNRKGVSRTEYLFLRRIRD